MRRPSALKNLAWSTTPQFVRDHERKYHEQISLASHWAYAIIAPARPYQFRDNCEAIRSSVHLTGAERWYEFHYLSHSQAFSFAAFLLRLLDRNHSVMWRDDLSL